MVERVGLRIVVRGEDQALLGSERRPGREHMILRLGADPAEDRQLPLELREQQQRHAGGDAECGEGASAAQQAPVEHAPDERDHPRQPQHPWLCVEANQRDVETRTLERLEQEAGGLVKRGAAVLARSFRELREQGIPGGHRRADGSTARSAG